MIRKHNVKKVFIQNSSHLSSGYKANQNDCHFGLVSESDSRNNFTRVRFRNKFGMTKNIKAAFTLAEVKPLCPDGVAYKKCNLFAPIGLCRTKSFSERFCERVSSKRTKGNNPLGTNRNGFSRRVAFTLAEVKHFCPCWGSAVVDGKGEQSMKRKNILASICHSELVSESDNCNNFTKVRSRNKFGMTKNIKAAFTLAEVLITLLIIGVVAALTLPTLMQNISDRKNSTKVAVFNSKFIQGLNLTKNAGEMGTQYSSTYDFLKNGLSNHLKMAAICDSSHLKDCLGYDEIKYEMKSGKEKTVKVSSLKTADKLNVKDAGFEDTASFIMGDGTPVLLSYNLNCMDDGGVDKTISSCVAGLFDLNGSSQPNMFINKVTTLKNGTIKSEAHDIRSFNGASVYRCVGEIDDMCITNGVIAAYDQMYEAIKIKAPDYVYPTYTYNDSTFNDYWQMANDYCEKVAGGHMANYDDFAKISTALYGVKIDSNISWAGKGNITMKNKDSVLAALGMSTNFQEYKIWIGNGAFSDHAAEYWWFKPTWVGHNCSNRSYGTWIICVGD